MAHPGCSYHRNIWIFIPFQIDAIESERVACNRTIIIRHCVWHVPEITKLPLSLSLTLSFSFWLVFSHIQSDRNYPTWIVILMWPPPLAGHLTGILRLRNEGLRRRDEKGQGIPNVCVYRSPDWNEWMHESGNTSTWPITWPSGRNRNWLYNRTRENTNMKMKTENWKREEGRGKRENEKRGNDWKGKDDKGLMPLMWPTAPFILFIIKSLKTE